jgi:preprotein translocase subunit SecF
MHLEEIITKYPPRQILLIPLAIIALALIILGVTYLSTGSPVKLGVEFTGGTMVSVPASESMDIIAEKFAAYPVLDIRKLGRSYMIQFGPMSESDYKALSSMVTSQYKDPEIRYMGPIYSSELQSQAIKYIPLSFILMALVVFIIFRKPFISSVVAGCALADILIAAASMNITGVKLSLGTVAALLMLIGYSVDTDILLTKTALARRQTMTVDDSITSAMTTGLMMTGTTIAAVFALFLASNVLYLFIPSFTRMDIIADISTVLLFGLVADIFNTWITNAQVIRWMLNRPKSVEGKKK